MVNGFSKEEVDKFLVRVKRIENEQYRFQPREKNRKLDNEFGLSRNDKCDIIRSLKECECIDISKNRNPNYPDEDVFTFIAERSLISYGEVEGVKMYIKLYITNKDMDLVIIISLHENEF